MNRRRWIAAAALLVVALLLRLVLLSERPPHHDEGVNGWFVEKMSVNGYYAYDPKNYHGPAYFYLLAAARAVLGVGLFELRIVCALIGAVLCMAPLLLRRRLGTASCLAASALLVTSPTLVYYARYAIHETLFVALGVLVVLCTLRFAAHGRVAWIYGAGAALAGMIATKETTILFVGVFGLWLLGETAVETRRAGRLVVFGRQVRFVPTLLHAGGVVCVMAAIHLILFTGFFQDPKGIGDALERSVRAYMVWTKTGTGESGHEKVWSYYFQIGFRYELVLYLFAAYGLVSGIRNREIRCLGVVGFGLVALYSMIPYKMPWLPMTWLALLAIPAGRGIVTLALALGRRLERRVRWQAIAVLVIVPALAITTRSSFVRPADAREQLAYVHTSPDYNEWFGLLEKGAAGRDPKTFRIALVHPAMWPFPWSFAPYAPRWFSSTGDEDVIIMTTAAGLAMEKKLTSLYLRGKFRIRDAAPPAFVYFRSSTFSHLFSASGKDGKTRFVLVGPRQGGGVIASSRK